MASRTTHPRRLQTQNSFTKQENSTDPSLHSGRHPLRSIQEASTKSLSTSEQTEPGSSSKPPTPRGKKRAASVYRQSENVDGNIGSASNSPEKPREKRTTLTRVAKVTAPWPSKLPVTTSLARSLQESLQQTDAVNKSWDSDSVGGTPTTSNRTTAIPTTGASKSGFIDQTPRIAKFSGKPSLDSEPSRSSMSSNNSSLLQSIPSRSVNRSLRYGATTSSAASVGSTRAPVSGKSSGSFQFFNGQQTVAQQFDFDEESTFWEDHNVQVIIRTRPISASESAVKGSGRCVRQENSHSITWIGQPETRFTFDHVAGEHITQEKLFRVAGVPMVENCIAGYNSCMFCYGQTGSGKTHTMLGDIVDLEQRPSDDRGITPRVFEYLFSRIQKEEETRTDEHLKYVCKCSFLEIYNEQITDLLEPTSTNLQVREGGKKGVYVENLSEVAVGSVQDVVHLLLLGAANRKVASTSMNRESSRSHSVFTCTIESKWEFNSVTNIRFGRLNLVDLAGSERQKSSGAEGERLKEATNINKSLSTLGLVIMILVDVANGKQRHVPYRDSKLTYLLQDSLGGNSKTTMIANISPSTCCALETLSTLKFAQRAKFIRNNAVVNGDASGDVNGLRQEIQELKEELDRMRRQDLPRTLSMHSITSLDLDSGCKGDFNLGMAVVAVNEQERCHSSLDSWDFGKALSAPRFLHKKLEAMEAVLAGALRREQEAELSRNRQAAEIELLTRLVKQREDDNQCCKMLLRFREDKISRLEALSAGITSADMYHRQERHWLMDELRLMQEKADRNPELTRFAMENIRLLEQLRRFQDFYTGGEREAMADEISNLRDQLLEVLDSKLSLTALTSPQRDALAPELAAANREIELLRIEADNYRREVEDCRKNLSFSLEANSRLTKQLDELSAEAREVKLECQAYKEELQKLRDQALDVEAIEWGHAQHVELISNLKIKLQQSEGKSEREAKMRSELEEQLKASLQKASDLHGELQKTMGALDAAEMLVRRLQSAESNHSVAQEPENREKLDEAHSVIEKLSSSKDKNKCLRQATALLTKDEQSHEVVIEKSTVSISQLEQELKSLGLPFERICIPQNTSSIESARERLENITKDCYEMSKTQEEQPSDLDHSNNFILKLDFAQEEDQRADDGALLESAEKDLQAAQLISTKELQDDQNLLHDACSRETKRSYELEEVLQLESENEMLRSTVKGLFLFVNQQCQELCKQENVFELKLQKVDEKMEDAHRQMTAILVHLDALYLMKEKLEADMEFIEQKSLQHCSSIKQRSSEAYEDKKQLEDVFAERENELLGKLSTMKSENVSFGASTQALVGALEDSEVLLKEEMAVLRRDCTASESMAIQIQEKLRTSILLAKDLARSEEQWKIQKESLAAENKRLTRCMACREMEFLSLLGQKEDLEKNLKAAHEKERLASVALTNLKEDLRVLEKQWQVEREQLKDHLVVVNRELLESQEAKHTFSLKELEDELMASTEKCEVIISTFENQWITAREEISSHLTEVSEDFIEVKRFAEESQLDLAKSRSLLSAADAAIERLLEKSSALEGSNKQLLEEREAHRLELSRWEQYAMELHESSCVALSPLNDDRAVTSSEARPNNYYFDLLKEDVEGTRRECENLRAEMVDKDNTNLSAQMELSCTIASSRQVESELECVADERNHLKLQLNNVNRALVNARDEVRCREVQLEQFEDELHKVMEILAKTEEKMDESARDWRKQIEEVKADMEAAKLCAIEKGSEVTMLRRQFEHGQTTLQEAELLVNALVRANDSAKLDVLKWKSREENMALQSFEMLSMIEEEMLASMELVENQMQVLGLDIHIMRTLVTGSCSEIVADFNHEFKEFVGVQISEMERATEEANIELSKMNAKVIESELRLHESVMENEILQLTLTSSEELLKESEAALADAMQNIEAQHFGWAATRDELRGTLGSLAEMNTCISDSTSECDRLSTRIVDLEKLFSELREELNTKLKDMELEKLTLVAATNMLQVANTNLHGHVHQLAVSVADDIISKQVMEMEIASLPQLKDSYEDEIHKLQADLDASRDAVKAAAAKLLETESSIPVLNSNLENSRNEMICVQRSLDHAVTDMNRLRLHALDLQEKDVHLQAQAEILRLMLKRASEKLVQVEADSDAAMEILATMLESTSSELFEKENVAAELEENRSKFYTMLASLQESVSLLGQEKVFLSEKTRALDADKRDLLDRLEVLGKQLRNQSEKASAASAAQELQLEVLKTIIESVANELQEKDYSISVLQVKLEQSSAHCFALDAEKKGLLEQLETLREQLRNQSQDASAASIAHQIELEILKTTIQCTSSELLEKDQTLTALREMLEESSVYTQKLLISLETADLTSAQIEHERNELLKTADNLEMEKRVFMEELEMKSRKCADLGLQISRIQTESQDSFTESCEQKLELEILITMLESAVKESREKDAMASDLENLLSQSQLQNAEMLQSSQEVVNHFSHFQSQLDACFLQNRELERSKLALTAEVHSQSREVAKLKEERQALEKSLEEMRASLAQLHKLKDEEVRVLSDEFEKLKSQEAVMEADLWDWEQRCQDAEVQLDEKDSELEFLRGKLLATQEECKEQVELIYEELRGCQLRIAELDSERRGLINEIEEGSSLAAEFQEKLQTREIDMEEHFSRHSIEQDVLDALENEKRELQSCVKHLMSEVAAHQQRATAAENMQVETRLEMEALERDLKQKDDLLQSLESDLNLLQESALQELRLNQELESLRVTTDTLQQELNLQKERRTQLEIEIGQVTEEIVQIRNQAATWKGKAYELETELDKRWQTIESLEDELRVAEQNMANMVEEATIDLKDVENDRNRRQVEVLELAEQLEMTQAMVEERDAIASELHQAAELSKALAKEKENEAKLLARSVEELESIVYALESQLGLLKREAERQRLLREDMEMESQRLNNHIFVTQSALEESNTRYAEELKDTLSALKEKERKVEEKETEITHLRRKLKNLEISSKDKDVQINDTMAQIPDPLAATELKRMENRIERLETGKGESQSVCTTPNSNTLPATVVPNSAQEAFSQRGLAHVSCQSRIKELEELALSRQNEVFTLHTRLAEAESMTHDVLRDLVGVKTDMNNVVSMLGNQQIQQLAETARRKNEEVEEMEAELSNLRSQIITYIEERASWTEEINRRQCEMVAARVAAEKLRQKEQVLTDEIEKFRIENINHQEKIRELEMEIRKLPTGQQTFYEQINHHVKIAEENQALKLANENLSKELRRTELLYRGMHDEVRRYREAESKSTSSSFDEQHHLRHLLQEAEDSRAQAARKLSVLCTAIMQAAGLSDSEQVSSTAALDALHLLESRLRTTELELADSKFKFKVAGGRRIRRSDIRAKDTPLRSISNFTDLLKRASSTSPAPR